MSTRSQKVLLDGIPYAIHVDAWGSESCASWRCQQCASLVGGARWAATHDQATALAIAGVWEHHDDCHMVALQPVEALYSVSRSALETEYRVVRDLPRAMDLTDLSIDEMLSAVLEQELRIDWKSEADKNKVCGS